MTNCDWSSDVCSSDLGEGKDGSFGMRFVSTLFYLQYMDRKKSLNALIDY